MAYSTMDGLRELYVREYEAAVAHAAAEAHYNECLRSNNPDAVAIAAARAREFSASLSLLSAIEEYQDIAWALRIPAGWAPTGRGAVP